MTNTEEPQAPTGTRIMYRAALARDAADQAEVFYHAVMQGAATLYALGAQGLGTGAAPRGQRVGS
ncbi:hypothetical protein HORIV_55130 [Vreelandella olivaria]|uniref:Uncharacterized protein n=1 Tax=Vreelandella olivaria TaxID=390919 RepID=A0ABN5X4T1_9GAMM|nr:hypothetical protein HORIV_55130 [Halomonas olivaria]